MNFRFFLSATWPLLVLALGGLLRCVRSANPLRDPSQLLVLGGLATVPMLGKYGALPHYLLPLLCALVVMTGRFFGEQTKTGAVDVVATVGATLAALLCIRTESVPLPPPGSAATAQAFYDAVASLVEHDGRPLLALRPEYAYFHVDQPVEVEGSGFKFLLAAGAPGAHEVLARLEERRYRTVVLVAYGVREGEPLAEALHREYVSIGSCDLSYYSGFTPVLIMVPKDRQARFDPPPGTRCRGSDDRIPRVPEERAPGR